MQLLLVSSSDFITVVRVVTSVLGFTSHFGLFVLPNVPSGGAVNISVLFLSLPDLTVLLLNFTLAFS